MGYSKNLRWLKRFKKGTTFLDVLALGLVTFFSFFDSSSFSKLELTWLKSILGFLFKNKELILFISLIIIVFKKGFHKFYVVKKQPFKFREAILEEMLEDLFGNNRDIRITLFKEVNPFKNFLFNTKTFLKYYCSLKSYQIEPQWGNHIQVHQRAGWEIKTSKTTFFYSPNTRHHCQGIAARVIQNYESIEETNLPNTSYIDLSKININDLKNPDVLKVNDYMNRSFISDFNTLKSLNARAIHFHADAVYGDTGPIGVLIIDCLKGKNPFDDNMAKMPHYLNLLGSTLGGNIYE